MAYYKKIVGDRIYLSPRGSTEEETDTYTTWLNDFRVTDYTNKSGQVMTYDKEKDFLIRSSKDSSNRSFNIVDLENDKLIGAIGLEHFNWMVRTAELGIFIGDENYRSKGYGAEAIKLLLEYGFKYLNLHSIILDLVEINERAHKCYLKCGFKDTGYTRDQVFLNGKYYNILHMDILDTEFNGEYIRNLMIK